MAKIIFDSEKELEDHFMFLAEATEVCPALGYPISFMVRQVTIDGYGVADAISGYVEGKHLYSITVYELKKEVIDIKTIAQVSRYMVGVKKIVEKYMPQFAHDFSVHGVVIAPSINMNDDTIFLLQQTENITAVTVDFCLEKGCLFTEDNKNWIRTITGDPDAFGRVIANAIDRASKKWYADNGIDPELHSVKKGSDGEGNEL